MQVLHVSNGERVKMIYQTLRKCTDMWLSDQKGDFIYTQVTVKTCGLFKVVFDYYYLLVIFYHLFVDIYFLIFTCYLLY